MAALPYALPLPVRSMRSAMDGERSGVRCDPQTVIVELIDSALDHIAAARGCIVRVEPALKARMLNRSVLIVREICTLLSEELGAEVAPSVASLHDYLDRRLLCAMLDNDVIALDEARHVLHDVRCAWIFVPYEARGARAQS